MRLVCVVGTCFTCSDISVPMTTKNDSALRKKAAFIACGSLYPHLRNVASVAANKQRSEHPRQVELDRVVSATAFGRSFLSTERGQQRLIGRAAERLRDARHERPVP